MLWNKLQTTSRARKDTLKATWRNIYTRSSSLLVKFDKRDKSVICSRNQYTWSGCAYFVIFANFYILMRGRHKWNIFICTTHVLFFLHLGFSHWVFPSKVLTRHDVDTSHPRGSVMIWICGWLLVYPKIFDLLFTLDNVQDF